MPSLTSWSTVLIVVLFLIPGFIGDRLIGQLMVRAKRDIGEILLGAILWSLGNYVVFLPIVWVFTYAPWAREYPAVYAATAVVFVLFIAPIAEAVGIAWLVGLEGIEKLYTALGFRIHPTPKSWDWVFSRQKEYFIRITCTDDTRIGGRWTGPSFASSFPADEDLYLAEQWALGDTGQFLDPIPLSAGLLVKRSDVKLMELFEVLEKEPETTELATLGLGGCESSEF